MKSIGGKFIVLALAVALLVGVLNLVVDTLQAQSSGTSWGHAVDIAPQGLMEQIAAETLNPDTAISLGRMRILPIETPAQQTLYLIDTRIISEGIHSEVLNPLCGKWGCAFLGYLLTREGYRKILNLYLDPRLPPNVHLIEVTDKWRADLPELNINQLEGDRIRQFTLSFNHQKYEVIDTKLFPKRYE